MVYFPHKMFDSLEVIYTSQQKTAMKLIRREEANRKMKNSTVEKVLWTNIMIQQSSKKQK